MIDTRTAEHEAAHITVGCALGLHMAEASAVPRGADEGWTWFPHAAGLRAGVMLAAGLAYEKRYGEDPGWAESDVSAMRADGWGPLQIVQLTRAADGILMALRGPWRRVVALLEAEDIITARHIEELIHEG